MVKPTADASGSTHRVKYAGQVRLVQYTGSVSRVQHTGDTRTQRVMSAISSPSRETLHMIPHPAIVLSLSRLLAAFETTTLYCKDPY